MISVFAEQLQSAGAIVSRFTLAGLRAALKIAKTGGAHAEKSPALSMSHFSTFRDA
jgi:hypothetical protein